MIVCSVQQLRLYDDPAAFGRSRKTINNKIDFTSPAFWTWRFVFVLAVLRTRNRSLRHSAGVMIAIDRSRKQIILEDGSRVSYDHLMLCTGQQYQVRLSARKNFIARSFLTCWYDRPRCFYHHLQCQFFADFAVNVKVCDRNCTLWRLLSQTRQTFLASCPGM